jgi:DICT domain-containing protein
LTKASLVHLSHTLEDLVIRHRLPALIFTGFQESSHWRKETERYRALAGVAKQVCIFAGRPLPADSAAGALQITLAPGDPFRQEWFLLILSNELSALLCGLDQAEPTEIEGQRTFETLWSFEPGPIHVALEVVEAALGQYAPNKLAELRAARQTYTPGPPTSTLLGELMQEMIGFESRLYRELSHHEQTQKAKEALEAQLKQEQDMLTFKDQLLTAVSHEFRTPLSIIMTSAEILGRYSDKLSPEDVDKRLGAIGQQVAKLRQLLDKVTDEISPKQSD